MENQSSYKDICGWQLYPEKKVLETPVVNIYSGPVRCKRSGIKRTFYHLDFPDWVNIIALTPEHNILLIRQFRYGTRKEELEIPGGVIEKGENPVNAGCRELLEECGYTGQKARIIGKVCPNPAIQKNFCYTILVENAVKTTEPNMDDMEDIELILRSRKELLNAFVNGSLEISHGLVLNALTHYRNAMENER